jgi:hypothetical protein
MYAFTCRAIERWSATDLVKEKSSQIHVSTPQTAFHAA